MEVQVEPVGAGSAEGKSFRKLTGLFVLGSLLLAMWRDDLKILLPLLALTSAWILAKALCWSVDTAAGPPCSLEESYVHVPAQRAGRALEQAVPAGLALIHEALEKEREQNLGREEGLEPRESAAA